MKIFHPLFFSIYPILFLFSYNQKHIQWTEILTPLAVSIVGVSLFWWIFKVWFRSVSKSAFLVSAGVFLFFSYGHWFGVLKGMEFYIDGKLFGAHFVLFPIFCFSFFLLGLYLKKTEKSFLSFGRVLNGISLFLVVACLFQVLVFEIKKDPLNKTKDIREGFEVQVPQKRPDIYYLVFDRYPSQKTLKKFFDYDNTHFLNFLEEKGFYVAEESRANYLKTSLSLASTLNLNYLDQILEVSSSQTDWSPIYEKIKTHQLAKVLDQLGYFLIHAGSWWEPTRMNPLSHLNLNYSPLSEFMMLLYQTSLLEPVFKKLDLLSWRKIHWRRVQYKFDEIKKIPEDSRPTFLFAHFIVPHLPYVFDEEGRFVSEREEKTNSEKKNYLAQLKYVNREIQALLEDLFHRSKDPPIIVLQSDEGPYPIRFGKDRENFDWRKATREEVQKKMGILNAFYLPEQQVREKLYPSISPVNTFRLILTEYFGADLPLLPDRAVAFRTEKKPYEWFDFLEQNSTESQKE